MASGSKARTFPPGESPFHAKGTLWLGIREFVEARVAGGVAGVADRLDAPHRTFFLDMFLASGWYDALPLVLVAKAIASAMRLDVAEYQRTSALWHAERDMKGAYAPVLQVDTPEAVCRRFANIYALCYDFGRAEVVKEEPRCIHACASGMPEPLAEWWMRASESYMEPVLRAAGAVRPRLIWDSPVADGERHGMPLVRITSRTCWD
jgi:hypothetical protein